MKSTRIYKLSLALVAMASASMATAANEPILQRLSVTDTVALGIAVSDITMGRNGDMMSVSMDINTADTKMKGDRAILYTPILVNGSDSLELNSLGLYGRVRWIQYLRNGEEPISGANEMAFQFKQRPQTLEYAELVPYTDWMNNATLVLKRSDYGCCRHLISEDYVDLARWRVINRAPELKYIRPAAERPKERMLEGEAFVDFPVDQTVIYPDYRNNAAWLDTIISTIDVVRNDPDATIQTVWLKGFASPESPYKHNTDLAIGRTAALKKYIQTLYNFDGATIITDYEPEDWEGLRAAVVKSNLPHRDEILQLIDSNMEPDAKEARIKKLYPDDYKFMHAVFYPPLRHTNYRVNYTVRSYDDPAEILKIMRTRPRNLALEEFYIAASVLEPGSDEFNEVFETAVRMYPDDATANLNAANSAITRGDYAAAARYLEKAGDTAEAEYARSVLSAMSGDYRAAKVYLEKAQKAGIEVDPKELEELQEIIEIQEN